MTEEISRRLGTVKQACAQGIMGKSKLYEEIASGEIKAYKREGRTLIDLDSIDEMNKRAAEAMDLAGGYIRRWYQPNTVKIGVCNNI